MPKLSSGQEAQRRLTENITLLWTLCETPEQPKENQIREGYDQGRQLPRNRETQLADSLAFISATTDDMRQVMALCIEEDPDKTGMTIRLASNTGDLSLVTEGFNGIARTLEQASLRGRACSAWGQLVRLIQDRQQSPGPISSKTYSVKLSCWMNLESYPA